MVLVSNHLQVRLGGGLFTMIRAVSRYYRYSLLETSSTYSSCCCWAAATSCRGIDEALGKHTWWVVQALAVLHVVSEPAYAC